MLPYAFVWEKTLKKNFILQNRGCLMAESLHLSLGTGDLQKLLKWSRSIDQDARHAHIW